MNQLLLYSDYINPLSYHNDATFQTTILCHCKFISDYSNKPENQSIIIFSNREKKRTEDLQGITNQQQRELQMTTRMEQELQRDLDNIKQENERLDQEGRALCIQNNNTQRDYVLFKGNLDLIASNLMDTAEGGSLEMNMLVTRLQREQPLSTLDTTEDNSYWSSINVLQSGLSTVSGHY